ncbi:MAG: hypothetical protein GY754_09030 [bacterium]|nr:hypothetical protein [bacterium]
MIVKHIIYSIFIFFILTISLYAAESEDSNPLSFGSYGEFIYENFSNEDESGEDSQKIDQVDMRRVVFMIDYNFEDTIIMNSRIGIEHGKDLLVEQLSLDYLFNDYLNFRVGVLLVPLGMINEIHEPTLILGSNRPLTEQYLIPTTWSEIGTGLYGKAFGFSYTVYGISSLDGVDFDSELGLREGRQNVSEAKAESLAVAARLDYNFLESSFVGVSCFYGNTGQDKVFGAATVIVDAHLDFKYAGIQFKSLCAFVKINEVEKINAYIFENIGKEMLGFYFEAGYDVLHLLETDLQLILFGRYEKVNTHYKVADGYTADESNDQSIITAGLSFKPAKNLVIKFDYQWISNKANTGINQFNMLFGYLI